jgi:hypothetical protein
MPLPTGNDTSDCKVAVYFDEPRVVPNETEPPGVINPSEQGTPIASIEPQRSESSLDSHGEVLDLSSYTRS